MRDRSRRDSRGQTGFRSLGSLFKCRVSRVLFLDVRSEKSGIAFSFRSVAGNRRSISPLSRPPALVRAVSVVYKLFRILKL